MQLVETNNPIKEETVRVFFAVWPDTAVQRRLDDLATQLENSCGGRKVRAENIHLTLLFLGDVKVSQLDALCQIASEVQGDGAQAFDFVVDEVRNWKHNHITYAGLSKTPQELLNLVFALQRKLSTAGFSFDQQAYVPHITLVRKAKLPIPSIGPGTDLPDGMQPVIWSVGEWVLVKSGQANGRSGYTTIGRWSLA
jgi:2'-5' RNA ligase